MIEIVFTITLGVNVFWIALLAHIIRMEKMDIDYRLRKMEIVMSKEYADLQQVCRQWADNPTTGNEHRIREVIDRMEKKK